MIARLLTVSVAEVAELLETERRELARARLERALAIHSRRTPHMRAVIAEVTEREPERDCDEPRDGGDE